MARAKQRPKGKKGRIMTKEEKILMLELLLKSLADCDEKIAYSRTSKAYELASRLGGDYEDLANKILLFSVGVRKGNFNSSAFEETFPNGYFGLDNFHNLSYDKKNKSQTFKDLCKLLKIKI